MKYPAFVGGQSTLSAHQKSVSMALGSYPLALATRRNWANQSQAVLQSRHSAPCWIRVGTTIANRHPPN